jgi:hypothetical protein
LKPLQYFTAAANWYFGSNNKEEIQTLFQFAIYFGDWHPSFSVSIRTGIELKWIYEIKRQKQNVNNSKINIMSVEPIATHKMSN